AHLLGLARRGSPLGEEEVGVDAEAVGEVLPGPVVGICGHGEFHLAPFPHGLAVRITRPHRRPSAYPWHSPSRLRTLPGPGPAATCPCRGSTGDATCVITLVGFFLTRRCCAR